MLQGQTPSTECLIIVTDSSEEYKFSSFCGQRDFAHNILTSRLVPGLQCPDEQKDAEQHCSFGNVNNTAVPLVKTLGARPLVDCPKQLCKLKLPSNEVLLAMFSCVLVEHALDVHGALCIFEKFFYFIPNTGKCCEMYPFVGVISAKQASPIDDRKSIDVELDNGRLFTFTACKHEDDRCYYIIYSIWLLNKLRNQTRVCIPSNGLDLSQGCLGEKSEEIQERNCSSSSLWAQFGSGEEDAKVTPLRITVCQQNLPCYVREAVDALVLSHEKFSFIAKLKKMQGMKVLSMSRWRSDFHRTLTLCPNKPRTQTTESSNIVETHHVRCSNHGRSAVLDIEQKFYDQTHHGNVTISHRWLFSPRRKLWVGLGFAECRWNISFAVHFQGSSAYQKSVEEHWKKRMLEDYACSGDLARGWLACNQVNPSNCIAMMW